MTSGQEESVIVDMDLAQAIYAEAVAVVISRRDMNPPFDVMAEQSFEAAAAYAVAVARRRAEGMDSWLNGMKD